MGQLPVLAPLESATSMEDSPNFVKFCLGGQAIDLFMNGMRQSEQFEIANLLSMWT
jgi:hypothetical protein